ncbi:hypothetical protein ACTXT7_010106 [Hymenolepis weldensis]
MPIILKLSGEECSESSFTTDQAAGNYIGLLKPVASEARMIDQVVAPYDQTRNEFWLQRTPSERFEVIPMLCRVKRISSRETQSEHSALPASQRPLRVTSHWQRPEHLNHLISLCDWSYPYDKSFSSNAQNAKLVNIVLAIS